MLAGPRCRAGDVQHVVEDLEAQPDAKAELAQRLDEPRAVTRRLERAQLARRLEQTACLQLAALEVTLDGHTGVPGVGALQQLTSCQR